MTMTRRAGTRNRDAGFTLIEILVAIVLVGILAAVVVVAIGRLTENASTASCATSADSARTASSGYFVTTGHYPTVFSDLTATGGSGGPALLVPSGASVVGRVLTVNGWALTMSATTPPTFSCSTVGGSTTTAPTTSVATTTTAPAATTTTSPATTTTTTTTAATTTTTTVSNGVTAVPAIAGAHDFYGENFITLSNTSTVTAMSLTIKVVKTTGLAYYGQWHDLWSGTVTSSHSETSSAVSFTFDLIAGQTIVPGTWKLDALTSGTGTLHPTAGDTWTVTTTSQGITRTLTGTF